MSLIGCVDRGSKTVTPSCHGESVAAKCTGCWVTPMRQYEVMVILDPELDARTIAPSLDTFLNVI